MRSFFIGALCIVLSCNSRQAASRTNVHVTAATLLTQRYATSPFAAWHIRATAAGSDCSVLVLQTEIILEDAMIEAMHYGAGAYNTFPGGVKQFTTDHAFRGVIYEDVSGRRWPYGAVTEREKEEVTQCR
jgi:hypothetical protein